MTTTTLPMTALPKNIEHNNGIPEQADIDISLKYLQAEFAQIDILLHREIRRWQLANQDSADSFRGFYVSHEDAKAMLDRGFNTSWGQTIILDPAEEQMYTQAHAHTKGVAQSILDKAKHQNKILHLTHLATVFGLDRFEINTLLIALAPTLDLRYEQIYGYLQDHVARKRPSANLVLNLLGEAGPSRLLLLSYFGDEAPLFKYQILKRVSEPGQTDTPLLNQNLIVDKTIVSWLWGNYHPHPDLGPHAKLTQVQSNDEPDPLLPPHIRESLTGITHTTNPIAIFYGPDRVCQEAAAKFIANQMNYPLLMVDLASVINDQFPAIDALRLVLRDARLTGAIPCLFGWDLCLDDKKTPSHLLAELCQHPGVVIVAGQEWWQASNADRDRLLFWQEFAIPNYTQRRLLWNHFLETRVIPATDEDNYAVTEIIQLADQFYLTTGQIRDAVMTAKDTMIQHNSTIETKDLFSAARLHSSSRLATLAKKIAPRYDWSDIILPEDEISLLEEIVNMVKGRTTVLEKWELGKKLASSKGVAILFGGPPGTGKTMGAEIIAGQLGLDLYKIDLSTLISKYIGETEKNLERIFREAESSNAILFFDEADSLFGKRSEVKDSHDRYANIEVSYLLQRMEAYNGVTILATNLRANLDEAFTRRLHFVVNFPFPDEKDRRRIWHNLFPQTVPRHADLNLDLMADRFKLAGGNIRNIIVSAAYLAANDGGEVTMEHLFHSTTRELQKMGRLVKERDMRL